MGACDTVCANDKGAAGAFVSCKPRVDTGWVIFFRWTGYICQVDGLYLTGGRVIFDRWTGYIWQVDGLYFSGGQVIFVRWTGYNKWHRGRKVETTVQPATHRLWQFLTNFDKFWTIFWQLWQSRHFFFTILTIEKTVLESCDIWDTDYNSDNWEPELRQSLLPHN